MSKNILLIVFLFISQTFVGQKDLNIKHMIPSRIYVSSNIKDTLAPGGYGGSNNHPLKMNDNLSFTEEGVFLKIDTSTIMSFADKFNGYRLYIGNNTDSIATFKASDSRIDVVAEVFYNDTWQPIEYLSRSWCGNSYHEVYLNKKEYWSFVIPKFSGKIKTKLRYKLILKKHIPIYSNEIDCSFNSEQLTETQKRTPNGIMDPYE